MASTRWAASRFHTLAFVSTVARSPRDDALGTVDPDSTRSVDHLGDSVEVVPYRAEDRLTEADSEPDLTTLVPVAEDVVVFRRLSPRTMTPTRSTPSSPASNTPPTPFVSRPLSYPPEKS
ncbi:hypothetical protein HKK80_06750 [Halonotius sp. F2-221B]|uniref:hypothetical protein n=1 Tax=Halonotius sp. F2-221B TaxID=2731620 RepID=UPI00398A85E8